MSATSRAFTDLRSAADQGVLGDLELIAAANVHLTDGEAELRAVRQLRDEAIRRYSAEHGPAETARRTGMSLSNVKQIRR